MTCIKSAGEAMLTLSHVQCSDDQRAIGAKRLCDLGIDLYLFVLCGRGIPMQEEEFRA